MPGPRPAQHARVRVVPPADDGAGDPLGEVAGRVVEVPEQFGGPRAGGREPAQRVARADHAGDRVDAVTRDVPHHEQQFLVRQQQGVVPVAGDQVPGLGRAVAHRDVHAGGLHRRRVRRHDGALQAQRELVLLGGALLGVRELVAGRGQRDLGVVVRGDILEGAPQRRHLAACDHRLGVDADLPDRGVTGTDDAESGYGRLSPSQQRLVEPPDGHAVRGDHEVVQVAEGDGRRLLWIETEEGERGVRPADRPRGQVLLPAAHLAEPLGVAEQLGEPLGHARSSPGEQYPGEERGDVQVADLHRVRRAGQRGRDGAWQAFGMAAARTRDARAYRPSPDIDAGYASSRVSPASSAAGRPAGSA